MAEAFGVAWAACGRDDEALRWYHRAVRCNDASASIKAQEQVASLATLQAWSAALAAAPASVAFDAVRDQLERTVTALKTLAEWQPTVERRRQARGAEARALAALAERLQAFAAHGQKATTAAHDGGAL